MAPGAEGWPMTYEEVVRVQRYWARFWMPFIGVGFAAGVVVGIGIGRLVE
jgi:hypothetical protein